MMDAVLGLGRRRKPSAAGQRFELTVSGSDRASMVGVTGPLDIQHVPRFLEELRPLCAERPVVVLDLRAADYVDSSGVRALMKLDEQMTAAQGELRLVVQPESRVERVLTLLRLIDRLQVYASTAEAWAGPGAGARSAA